MELLLTLLVLLLVTKIGADLAVRTGQPALVGELIAGVVLGLIITWLPASAGTVAELSNDRSFSAILDLAVFFLMLVAGLELRPRDLAGVTHRAAPVAIAGMLVPFGLGFALGWWWLPDSEWKTVQSVFLGVALAITAVPVAIKVLMDLGWLQTETGRIIVAAAVIDDVLSLVLLAVLTSLMSSSEALSLQSIALIGGRVAVFFAGAWLLGRYLLPTLGRLAARISVAYSEFSVVIILGLLLAVLAEWLHMHFLIGAFAAGLMFTRQTVGEDKYKELRSQFEALTMGFLAPIFFASIGMHLSLSAAIEIPYFVIALLVFAIAGKLVGAGAAALASGLGRREATAVGAAMNARGAVEIVIVAIVTTLVSPIMLRSLLPEKPVARQQ